jgi:bis(5'-nucleosyl)-tetraphosphatase (symmetrical)
MATYVAGDIQGCLKPLEELLIDVSFDESRDRLWLTGDLVNRGPDNLGVLRLIKSLGDCATVVLGNHDLHLLAVANGHRKLSRKDTLQDILQAPDREVLLKWLRQQPLMHIEDPWVLSHAGIPHIWSVEEAFGLAAEVHEALTGWRHPEFLIAMYGDTPSTWSPSLKGMERLRVITNYLTRMRFVSVTGELDLQTKEGSDQGPPGVRPWFVYPRKAADQNRQFLFGHWAALDGKTGRDGFYALDTGCIWGGSLTMMCLESGQHYRRASTTPS